MPRGRASAPSVGNTRIDQVQPQPISTVPGQPYGAAAEQQQAQQIAPMSGGGLPPPAGAGGGDLMAMLQQHVAGAPQRGPLVRPTERPNEPVTAGLPMGPGAGPEALTGVGALARQSAVSNNGTLGNLLQTLATQPSASAAMRDLASRALGGAQ